MAYDPNRLIKTSEIAAMFSVTVPTVTNWIKTGKLKGIKVNGFWRVKQSDLSDFISRDHGTPDKAKFKSSAG